ncbi:MAG: insulinase family protein [Bacteroidales bacterium]|nr:insulinase family protein [Bacteroidales bacterium]
MRDGRVREGRLGCGVTYYLVKNDQAPGFAHIAVAGKADAPVHHFPAVPVYKTVSLDSTLVKAFSLMADGPRAIVVSGDIDPAEIRRKLDLLSIQLPARPAAEADTLDTWSSRREPVIRLSRPGEGALSRVEVCYDAPPVPAHQRNTAQALVTDIFSRELVFILRHRLEKELAGIPCLPPSVSYEGLSQGSTRELFRVSVSTPEEHLDRVTAIVAGTLSCLEKEGVTRTELEDARSAMMPAMALEASAPLSNREWAIRCIRHFHYGTHLAPFSEEYRLFGRKALEGDVYKDLLNNFSGGLLDHARNLTLTLETTRDTLDYGAALNAYIFDYLQARIDGSGGRDYSWHAADTLSLNVATTRIRIKSERTEPLSGGTLWTFSNGLRVVFKPVKGSGRLHYAWQLDGGLAQISGLKEGEGGYIGPLLDVFGVGEMSAAAFHDMLAANGISLESRVALNGLALCGSAPPERLSLLLKALLGVSANRSVDMDAFQDYLQRETLSGEIPSAMMLRKLHPGYVYGSWKGSLSEKTLKKAEKFYDARLPHLADGILIISGDLSEETVRKHLLQYVGAIAPDHLSVPRRPVTLKTASGAQRVTGAAEGAFLLTDAAYAYTAEHYYTARLAADELQDRLERRIGPGVKVALRILRQPQERFRLLIGVERREDLPLVRGVLQAAAAEPLSAEDLKARRKKLEAVVKALLASPEGQVMALLERYSVNKDVTSRYGEAISAITAEGVQEFLRLMAEGGCIEYQGHE